MHCTPCTPYCYATGSVWISSSHGRLCR